MAAISKGRLSVLALAALGGGVATAGPAAATGGPTPPTVTETLSADGGTVAANGDLTVPTPNGNDPEITVNVAWTFQAAGGAAVTYAMLNCDDGRGAWGVGSADGKSFCLYSKPGTYSVTLAAYDNQTPQQSTTVTHTVTITGVSPVAVDRYDGASRYGTGVAVSRAAFPANGSAGAVVLARGDVFADALAGIPLAKAKNASLLLTPGGPAATTLDPNVEAELVRVLPRDKSHTVYVLGGVNAISPAIESYISTTLGYDVVRLSGSTRFDTALAIAEDPRALNNPDHVVVARGDDFADALAAGPYASNAFKGPDGIPAAIILSSGPASDASLSQAGAAYVETRLTGQNVAAIGGGAVAAVDALPNSEAHVVRISGADRYATSANVANLGWSHVGMSGMVYTEPNAGLATGTAFPDALTGGAYMALTDGPLILTNPVDLGDAARNQFLLARAALRHVSVFGGTGALAPAVVSMIAPAVAPAPTVYTEHRVLF